jgi:hypothetical protein
VMFQQCWWFAATPDGRLLIQANILMRGGDL